MHISVGENIRFGWETYKRRPLFITGGFALAFLASIAVSFFMPSSSSGVVALLFTIATIIVSTYAEIGMINFALRAHDNVETVSLHDLLRIEGMLWGYYFVAKALMGIAVMFGIILLIVPGIIVALGLMFTSYLVVDKNRGPIEALKESWRLTRGYKMQLFVLMIGIIGINILGALMFFVGLLVSIPVSMLAVVHVYRALEQTTGEGVPVPVA